MAKRKRLTPPSPAALQRGSSGVAPMFGGPVPAPPIADVARDAAASAALEDVARHMAEARESGRLVLSLPLDSIDLDYLVRDRLPDAAEAQDGDMAALMASLKERGQQAPIEVVELGDQRYGLISGWRRCQALMRLARDTGEPRFATVLALLRRPDQASDAYVAMVEENEIRVGLSYYERARIAAKAVDQGVFETEKKALLHLFHAASRAKRSKIRSFLTIVRALDGALQFPAALGERTGLVLAKALEADPDLGARLNAALAAGAAADPAAEQQVLQQVLDQIRGADTPDKTGSDTGQKPARQPPQALARDLWMRDHPDGSVTLSGPALTADRKDRLIAWLKADG